MVGEEERIVAGEFGAVCVPSWKQGCPQNTKEVGDLLYGNSPRDPTEGRNVGWCRGCTPSRGLAKARQALGTYCGCATRPTGTTPTCHRYRWQTGSDGTMVEHFPPVDGERPCSMFRVARACACSGARMTARPRVLARVTRMRGDRGVGLERQQSGAARDILSVATGATLRLLAGAGRYPGSSHAARTTRDASPRPQRYLAMQTSPDLTPGLR